MDNALMDGGNKTIEQIYADLTKELEVERTTVFEISDFSGFSQFVREHARRQKRLCALIALFDDLIAKKGQLNG